MADVTRDHKERKRKIRRRRYEAGAAGGLIAAAAVAVGMIVGSNSAADQEQEARAVSPSKGLSDHVLAGQRTIGGFSGRTIPRPVKKAIRAGRSAESSSSPTTSAHGPPDPASSPVGFRTSGAPEQVCAETPLLIMVDQEGGLVKRLSGAPAVSAEEMGARGGAYSKRQGRLTGRNLKNAGFNVDLAPVLDVARPGGNIADTDRGFGTTVRKVKTTAIPFAQGLQSAGTAATAKHFPGHRLDQGQHR